MLVLVGSAVSLKLLLAMTMLAVLIAVMPLLAILVHLLRLRTLTHVGTLRCVEGDILKEYNVLVGSKHLFHLGCIVALPRFVALAGTVGGIECG